MRKSTGKVAEFHAEWSKKYCDAFVSPVEKYEDWGRHFSIISGWLYINMGSMRSCAMR